MYVPQHFTMADAAAADLAAGVGVGHLITSGDRLDSSFVPFLLDRTDDGLVVRAHLAAANPQRHAVAAGADALLIVHGPDAYVSPGHYPSKKDHGRVVPTWNYAIVHLHGNLRQVEGREDLLRIVEQLTDRHEATRAVPWSVSDAPPDFIDGQLAAIVGLELRVTTIEGKSKLSQNRPAPDREAVRAAFLAGDSRQQAVGRMMH
ncbi:MAG: FMN-binding negative transcriptional regulator [Ilumatobacteraceae bacterium]